MFEAPSPRSSSACHLVRERALGSRARVVDLCYREGWRFAEHEHLRPCVTLVLSGGFRERYRGRLREASAGSVLHYHARSWHSGRISPRGASVFQLEFSGEPTPGAREHADSNLAAGLVRELYWESSAKDGDELVLLSLACELAASTGSVSEPDRGPSPKWFETVVHALREERDASVGLETLAELAGLHPCHFAREFRRRSGTSVGEFRRRLRVARVAALLTGTKQPIAELAYETGFSDQSHLGRWFKRFTGMTPLQYRASGKPLRHRR